MIKFKPKKKMPSVAKDFLAKILKENNIKFATVEFCGSGDDGQIDYVDYDSPISRNVATADLIVVPPEVWEVLENNKTLHCKGVDELECAYSIEDTIIKFVEHWIYNETPVDWVNGDGGSGKCIISFYEDGELSIELSVFEYIREEGPEHHCDI